MGRLFRIRGFPEGKTPQSAPAAHPAPLRGEPFTLYPKSMPRRGNVPAGEKFSRTMAPAGNRKRCPAGSRPRPTEHSEALCRSAKSIAGVNAHGPRTRGPYNLPESEKQKILFMLICRAGACPRRWTWRQVRCVRADDNPLSLRLRRILGRVAVGASCCAPWSGACILRPRPCREAATTGAMSEGRTSVVNRRKGDYDAGKDSLPYHIRRRRRSTPQPLEGNL
mgnify:CR=1 FL=1